MKPGVRTIAAVLDCAEAGNPVSGALLADLAARFRKVVDGGSADEEFEIDGHTRDHVAAWRRTRLVRRLRPDDPGDRPAAAKLYAELARYHRAQFRSDLSREARPEGRNGTLFDLLKSFACELPSEEKIRRLLRD